MIATNEPTRHSHHGSSGLTFSARIRPVSIAERSRTVCFWRITLHHSISQPAQKIMHSRITRTAFQR